MLVLEFYEGLQFFGMSVPLLITFGGPLFFAMLPRAAIPCIIARWHFSRARPHLPQRPYPFALHFCKRFGMPAMTRSR